jgi:hypothetical protein
MCYVVINRVLVWLFHDEIAMTQAIRLTIESLEDIIVPSGIIDAIRFGQNP